MLNELRKLSAAQLLLLGAFLLTLAVISFSAADIIASSTSALFIFLVLVMIILTLTLIKAAYPKTSPFDVVIPESVEERRQRPEAEGGTPPFSELRRVLINRVQLRREIDGARWASIKNDREALSRLVEDEDLVELIMFNEIRFSKPSERITPSREAFERLLAKVEKWR